MNNTLVKGLRLLDLMARSPTPVGITEVAIRLKLGKGDVHRLMQSLVELGFARRVGTNGTYAASTKLWELGTVVLANLDLRKVAGPHMERLSEVMRETVHLGILDGADVIQLHQINGPEIIRTHVAMGSRLPAHSAAAGKAMLATLDDVALEAFASSYLTALTERTITGRARFIRAIRRCREVGYAVSRGEYSANVSAVAAAIVDRNNAALGCIGVSGPSERLRPARFEALGDLLRKAAQQISSELAGAPASATTKAASAPKQRGSKPSSQDSTDR